MWENDTISVKRGQIMNPEKDELLTYEQEIIQILRSSKTLLQKREQLDQFHNFELAQSLLEMDKDDLKKFFSLFNSLQLANVFAQLDPEAAVEIFRGTQTHIVSGILNLMESDDLVDIIECFEDRDERVTYLSLIKTAKRSVIKNLIDFDNTLVGSIMNNSFIEIKKTDTVKQAIKTIVELAPSVEFIHNIYVTDSGYLEGVLSLKEIISLGNNPNTMIYDVMTLNLITITTTTKTEDAIEMMKNYDFFLLPVVDSSFHIIGIVSFDDMVEALNQESDSDYFRLAGIMESNQEQDKETIYSSVKKRMPWLVILLFINLVTSSIVSGYEGVLTLIPTLALFMPLILNMAGNTGTQSLGIIIRLFATNQLETKKAISKHLVKEFMTGLINGFIISLLLFVLVIVLNLLVGTSISNSLPFALVISLSIGVALVVSTLAGSIVPLIMNMFKVDPAVASGPFITTINDIISLLIYFGLASILLGNLI